MSKKLIIVESPSKAVTIEKYLKADGYKVIASKGHIRDLPIKELGIDIKNDFEMNDVTMEGKEKVIKDIKAAAKDADEIFLASDPDREGEKISQSINEILPKKGKRLLKKP
jgi:DNA topoisomerase-1